MKVIGALHEDQQIDNANALYGTHENSSSWWWMPKKIQITKIHWLAFLKWIKLSWTVHLAILVQFHLMAALGFLVIGSLYKPADGSGISQLSLCAIFNCLIATTAHYTVLLWCGWTTSKVQFAAMSDFPNVIRVNGFSHVAKKRHKREQFAHVNWLPFHKYFTSLQCQYDLDMCLNGLVKPLTYLFTGSAILLSEVWGSPVPRPGTKHCQWPKMCFFASDSGPLFYLHQPQSFVIHYCSLLAPCFLPIWKDTARDVWYTYTLLILEYLNLRMHCNITYTECKLCSESLSKLIYSSALFPCQLGLPLWLRCCILVSRV